jgi:hypothetical protein
LSAAGLVEQSSQTGLSQVPLLRLGTFQSQRKGAGAPQAHLTVRPRA